MAQQFAVNGFPAFVILDASGNKLDEFAGYRTPSEFVNRLRLRTR